MKYSVPIMLVLFGFLFGCTKVFCPLKDLDDKQCPEEFTCITQIEVHNTLRDFRVKSFEPFIINSRERQEQLISPYLWPIDLADYQTESLLVFWGSVHKKSSEIALTASLCRNQNDSSLFLGIDYSLGGQCGKRDNSTHFFKIHKVLPKIPENTPITYELNDTNPRN